MKTMTRLLDAAFFLSVAIIIAEMSLEIEWAKIATIGYLLFLSIREIARCFKSCE